MIEDIYKKFKEKYPCIDELLYENKKWIIKTNDINKNIDIIKLCEKLIPYIEKNLNNNDKISLYLNGDEYIADFHNNWKFIKTNRNLTEEATKQATINIQYNKGRYEVNAADFFNLFRK